MIIIGHISLAPQMFHSILVLVSDALENDVEPPVFIVLLPGMSKHFQSRAYMRSNEVGTTFYKAPEIFKQRYTY